jgi:hypothetical protein
MREDPARLEVELAKAGTTAGFLVRDARDEPALQEQTKLLTSDEAMLRVALEWFGDRGHPQPERRTPRVLTSFGHGTGVSAGLTPDWGRLPSLESAGPPTDQPPRPKKPRHRPPDPIAKETVTQLMVELEQRKATPVDPEFTQWKIAERVRLNVNRVQQAERLQDLGWDLLRTHPDFLVDEGYVCWPGDEKAARILDADRTEK